ncbi:MAG: hypothetical protein DRP11_05575, partial [Candidatus Aenigmatarchaeota archaeon]
YPDDNDFILSSVDNEFNLEEFGNVPIDWYLIKYTICSSHEECTYYTHLDNSLLINYNHPSCTLCDQDQVQIDWLYLEVYSEEYCDAYTESSSWEWISSVRINETSIFSGNDEYSDFTGFIFENLNRGSTYVISVTVNTVEEYVEYVKVWIDFNNDNQFSDDEEIDLGSAVVNGTYTFSGTFTVPNDAELTETRMRVYLKYESPPTPCEIASFGEVEDYTVKIVHDDEPPFIWKDGFGITKVDPESYVTIRAYVYDNYDVSKVLAEIKSNENVEVVELEKVDEDLYEVSWFVPSGEKDYSVSIIAYDVHGNVNRFDNFDRFTTTPFNPTSQILLVDNSKYYDTSVINYYINSLNANGYKFDIWISDLRGDITADVLSNYRLCIWSDPYGAPNEDQQHALATFLESDGMLFISGQDIGWYIGSTEFYQNYLHSVFVEDDTDMYELSGVNEDPITADIYSILIIGGDGANNQMWPSAISNRSITMFTVERRERFYGLCVEYSYHIIPIVGLTPPMKMTYDENYPINSSHLRIIDEDGKYIDLETYENRTCCDIVCDYPQPEFTQVIYDGNPVADGYCKTTDAGNEVCFINKTSVSIKTNFDSIPIFYYRNPIAVLLSHPSVPQSLRTIKHSDTYNGLVEDYIDEKIGAIRVDTGIYKVVYFAFGFEAISNEEDRNLVMEKVINWLGDFIPPTITVSSPVRGNTYTTSLVPIEISLNEQGNIFVYEEPLVVICNEDSENGTEEIETPILSCENCNVISTVFNFSEGYHLLRIVAIDMYGNVNETFVSFSVDLSPPVIEFIEKPDKVTLGESIFLEISVNDISNIQPALISINGEPNITMD